MEPDSDPLASVAFDVNAFERAKSASVAQLLFRCARLLNDRALERIRAKGGLPMIRASHTTLFPHLELHGIRLTDLARRMHVSKQAASQLVDEMVQMGALARVPDPHDGRAKLIVFTDAGKRGLMAGLGVLSELEGELSARVGPDVFAELQTALTALLDALES